MTRTVQGHLTNHFPRCQAHRLGVCEIFKQTTNNLLWWKWLYKIMNKAIKDLSFFGFYLTVKQNSKEVWIVETILKKSEIGQLYFNNKVCLNISVFSTLIDFILSYKYCGPVACAFSKNPWEQKPSTVGLKDCFISSVTSFFE